MWRVCSGACIYSDDDVLEGKEKGMQKSIKRKQDNVHFDKFSDFD